MESFHCEYAARWIMIKSHWALTITSDEYNALREAIDTCVVLVSWPMALVRPISELIS